MKEVIKQYGSALMEAAGGIIVIGLIGVAFLGGGLAGIARIFSTWLYG